MIDKLEDAGLDVAGSLELLSMQRPYSRIRSLMDKHLSKHVTQRFQSIDKLYDSIGLGSLSAGVQKRAGRTTLTTSVEKLVNRRHQIAHSGDIDRNGKIRALSPTEVDKRLKDLRLFVDTAEQLISERMRPKVKKGK